MSDVNTFNEEIRKLLTETDAQIGASDALFPPDIVDQPVLYRDLEVILDAVADAIKSKFKTLEARITQLEQK